MTRCPVVVHDDPLTVARVVFDCWECDPDAAVLAAQWFEQVADILAEFGREVSPNDGSRA
jgi:hypothetical protein